MQQERMSESLNGSLESRDKRVNKRLPPITRAKCRNRGSNANRPSPNRGTRRAREFLLCTVKVPCQQGATDGFRLKCNNQLASSKQPPFSCRRQVYTRCIACGINLRHLTLAGMSRAASFRSFVPSRRRGQTTEEIRSWPSLGVCERSFSHKLYEE